jgi:hypothetical protein
MHVEAWEEVTVAGDGGRRRGAARGDGEQLGARKSGENVE